MSAVDIPDELEPMLRAVEGDTQTDLGLLVVRALLKYIGMCKQRDVTPGIRERMVRSAEKMQAALERTGITEEEMLRHFKEWRRRQPTEP